MECQTFSSVDKGAFQGRFPFTAAMVVLGGIAAQPPSEVTPGATAPAYYISANALSGGGYMCISQETSSTQSSIDSNTVPLTCNNFSSEDFSNTLLEGLQFIQRMAFLPVDPVIDKAIDSHFAGRAVNTKKLFINPYKKTS